MSLENMITNARKFFTLGLLLVFLFFALYAVLTFITPQTATSQEKLNISDAALFWVRISIIVIYAFVWFAAYYCARTLKLLSQKNVEFSSFTGSFSSGFILLLVGMITTTILGAIRGLAVHASPGAIPFLTIITNYAHILFPLAAFFLMWRGITQWTASDAPTAIHTGISSHIIRAGVVVFLIGLVYIPLVFTNPNRQITPNPDIAASYYLADPLIVITLILPALIAWALGIAVALRTNEKLLALDSPGAGTLTNGILIVIFSSMFLQVLLSFGAERLFTLGLGIILLLVYILIFLQAAGFLLTARGIRALEIAMK